MIDTIHFRIKNLTNYYALKNQYSATQKQGETEVYVSQNYAETKGANDIRCLLYHDYDNLTPVRHRSHLFVSSSHYNIAYSINHSGDYLDFNVSVPKYYFGTNIIQHINYYDQSSNACFYTVIQFFDDFFKYHCVQAPDYRDVEIRRIDLCYNQFFVSANDALAYLDKQKELNAKYARSSKNNFRSYDTSLMYVTGRYSFKIYHKGTEFSKHDKPALYKSGNPKNYDIDRLQHEADRILRYEMTFRNTMLNYIFKHDIVRASDLTHDFTRVLRMIKINYGKAADRVIDDYVSKTLSFSLSSNWQDLSGKNKTYEDYFAEYNLPFDSQLFSFMYKRFWKKVEDYQISIRLSVQQIVDKIEENEAINDTKNTLRKKRKNNPEKNRLLLIAILTQHINISSLKAFINERTLRRYKADLTKLGIEEYNSNFSIIPPPLDYVEYKYLFGKYHFSGKVSFSQKDYEIRPNKSF